MRAAVYARVSTEDQAQEGFSISAQLRKLRAYCKARDWEVVDEFVDEGYSGKEANRPAYQRMMAQANSWDVLVVLKMDRIHRNSKNFTLMMDELMDLGKEFNSMQENFDTTTAMGRFVMDIIQRIAQLESEQIGERVKMGMTQKAKGRGGYLGSAEPYGFRYHRDSLVPIREEAKVVEEIYRSYLEGLSLQDICDELNERGIPSKRGGKWTKQALSRMLRNPIYCGYYRWDGIVREGDHPALVTPETFNRVQERLERRVKNANGGRSAKGGGIPG
ncbi:MAG: recombinase family protein [Methanomassiliicoccales archaeon]